MRSRQIYSLSLPKRFSDAMRETGIFFRTTNEMLAEFTYLGEEEARRIVIENPKRVIADFDDIKPIPVSESYFKNLLTKIDKFNAAALKDEKSEAEA